MSTDHGSGQQTLYVRDASGQLLSLYERLNQESEWKQTEVPIYGSGRLGSYVAEGSSFESTQEIASQQTISSYSGTSYRYEEGASLTLSAGFSFTASATQSFSIAPQGTPPSPARKSTPLSSRTTWAVYAPPWKASLAIMAKSNTAKAKPAALTLSLPHPSAL
ncbi:hypothetical protein ADICEAN_04267 [Cesiribacter andamanensis AMV16]|uniref:Uncharacterized protein n=1 Tax=Cesiribacter andamanensis AMV16 TaxID=1279009 RepID=M7NFK6_9BACT|nr:hypothetical protein ADICEAN_04267 [Cesiribacter andamanensis AMV16]